MRPTIFLLCLAMVIAASRLSLAAESADERKAKLETSLADLDKAITADPKQAELYDRRGSVQFQLGHVDESIADFDRFLAIRPDPKPYHWKRGISYYYAGRYEDGRQQFEGYQTVDSSDVENAVWRYLCMARESGVKKARAEILPIRGDRRVPMSEIYELFSGKATPDDVLRAARAGDPPAERLNERLFYAELYLGLYYESEGDARHAAEHIGQAADKHKIGHYMWDVARVHADRLRAKEKSEAKAALKAPAEKKGN